MPIDIPLSHLQELFLKNLTGPVVRATLWILIGLPGLFFIARCLRKIISEKFNPHLGLLTQKTLTYVGFILITISILLDFHFDLSAILGTAGIASVAVGFAAKTSLSNLISGIFLLWEKPFQMGDLIQIDKLNVKGYVLSIDLLSVKIKTADNLFIRVPNETLVESDFTNISKFPIRRFGIPFNVSYDTPLENLSDLLLKTTLENPYCLKEPMPEILFESLGESGINYTLYAWVTQKNYTLIRNSLVINILNVLKTHNIEVPYPKIDICIKNKD